MKGLLPAALLLIFLCPGALAATAPPDPMRFWPEAIDGPDELGGPGRHAFNIIQSGIFDDLEQVIARAGTLQKRYVDGRSLLEAVQRGLYDGYLHYEGPVDAGLMGRVTEWRMKSPQSVAAPIVESIALTAHAWKVRSNTYARDVAPEAWESFQGAWRAPKRSSSIRSHVLLRIPCGIRSTCTLPEVWDGTVRSI
ncbi:MAG: hypothetical protein U1F35_23345 [Steroidobacteraceae bacterium]